MDTTNFIQIERDDGVVEYKHKDHDALIASFVPGEPLEYLKNMTPEQIQQMIADQKIDEIRNVRNGLLAECDWTQAADSPLSTEKKAEWAAYRQALRDLMSNLSDPFNLVWPNKPNN